jgi:hypothetical protein
LGSLAPKARAAIGRQHLGEVDAESLDAAQRIAADRWPGVRLDVREQSFEWRSTPKTGCRNADG